MLSTAVTIRHVSEGMFLITRRDERRGGPMVTFDMYSSELGSYLRQKLSPW